MKRLFIYILFISCLAFFPGCSGLYDNQFADFKPEGDIIEEQNYADYTVKNYRPETGEGSFVILKNGKIFYAKKGNAFYIQNFRGYNDPIINFPVGTDITGNGKPNLIIYEWTGGVHCCFNSYVFELDRQGVLLATIEGKDSIPRFEDINSDDIYEVILYDCTFAYWPGCFADSPAPKVIFKWNGKNYIVAANLMYREAPTKQELQSKAEQIKNSPYWPDEYSRWDIPRDLFSYALDLMYSGHEELGREFIKMAWTEKYPIDETLISEFEELLLKSPCWRHIRNSSK